MVELGRYPDAALAHIVKGRLEAAGIPAFCFDTGMNAAESVPLLFQVRLMVLNEDRDDALAMLRETAEDFTGDLPAMEEISGLPEPRHYQTGGRRRRWALYCALAYLGIPILAYLIVRATSN
ncbi:DUF2007 domain-containing protein [Sphingobium sp. H33]|uniref:DUF2007 domain-containing protein n=1 Tax=Sphingobium nicotianae TaxID=2782607 RepID=A0A9X1DF28_9SPHN|nr:DUF2007 domain-containing protein [Sphingobium nicotianae]MBT2188734.1 DUF2007 domain-containing protein [Sphingobium nicotianae]